MRIMSIWEYDTCRTVEPNKILKNTRILLKQYKTHEIFGIALNEFIFVIQTM